MQAVVLAAVSMLGSAGGADAQRALFDTMTRSSSTPEVAAAAAAALETIGGATARSQAALIAKYRAAYAPNADGEGQSEEPEQPTASAPTPAPDVASANDNE